jgi:NAD dependent epimerase/dehydratase family enzyme
MADALLLASTRVRPARLEEAGFTFQYPELEGALRAVLKERK